MSPRRLLAVLAVPVLALSACGGDDLSAKPAAQVIKDAFGPGKSIRSGRLDLRFALNGSSSATGDGPFQVALRGPFASTGGKSLPTFDFDLSLQSGSQTIPVGAVTTADKAWLKVAGQAFAVPDASYQRFKALYAKDQQGKGEGTSFSALGVDPARWLAAPKQAGAESISGTDTVHVTSKLDVPAFLADVNKLLGRTDVAGAASAAGAQGKVPSKLSAAQVATIEQSVKNTSLDVFVGKDDGTLRRLNIQVTYDVPAAARKASGGLTAGTLGFDLVISELNEKQTITAPRSARPLSDLTQRGATGATGAATTTTPSGPPAAYTACIQRANGSALAIQKCQPLLASP